MMLISFCVIMLCFFAVGLVASAQRSHTMDDYLLAGRRVHPWLAGLSALSSGQSAFLFTAQVGYAYTHGLSAFWLAVGWAIGDYLAWRYVYNNVRARSERMQCNTIIGIITRRGGRLLSHIISKYAAGCIIILMSFYAAAQFVAGGKILHHMFDWPSYAGVLTGAVLVFAYCATGGIRASIWTDAVQTLVMMASLGLLFITMITHVGGWHMLWNNAAQPVLPDTAWGFAPFFTGWVVAGFGAVGQPHILNRGMSVADERSVTTARNVKVFIGLVTAAVALSIGLLARHALPDLQDPETALFAASKLLLPDILVGLMLAGFFAALISTADSQILAASSALSQDLLTRFRHNYRFARLATVGVIIMVVTIALFQHASVFTLVTLSWSVLASSIGVGVLIALHVNTPDTPALLAAMITGPISGIIWRYGLGFSPAMYEAFPAMVAGLLTYYGFSMVRQRVSAGTRRQND